MRLSLCLKIFNNIIKEVIGCIYPTLTLSIRNTTSGYITNDFHVRIGVKRYISLTSHRSFKRLGSVQAKGWYMLCIFSIQF